LLAAYRLAVAGHGDHLAQQQEITLEQNKISLKSSVTGLLILVVSFAFFMVYVAWVFTIREVPLAQDRKMRETNAQTVLPEPGGVGAPPAPTSAPQ
jgi:hypothetical protein